MVKHVLLLASFLVMALSLSGCGGCDMSCTPKQTTPAENAAWKCANLEGDEYTECIQNELE